MTYSIATRQLHPVPPAQRRPALLAGPTCRACTHRSCRRRRAASQPRLGGRRAEFAAEHTRAARLQARNPTVVVYYGESTQSYWVATADGLSEVTEDALMRIITASRTGADRFTRDAHRVVPGLAKGMLH